MGESESVPPEGGSGENCGSANRIWNEVRASGQGENQNTGAIDRLSIDKHSILNLSNAVNGGIAAEQIAERAYFRWLDRGCPLDSPEVDWFSAEQELALLR